jgi:hypothetical protein
MRRLQYRRIVLKVTECQLPLIQMINKIFKIYEADICVDFRLEENGASYADMWQITTAPTFLAGWIIREWHENLQHSTRVFCELKFPER